MSEEKQDTEFEIVPGAIFNVSSEEEWARLQAATEAKMVADASALLQASREALVDIRSGLEGIGHSRQKSLAITKIEEAEMWLGRARAEIDPVFRDSAPDAVHSGPGLPGWTPPA